MESIGWVLPVDNWLFRIYASSRMKPGGGCARMRSAFAGRFGWKVTQEARCAGPDDDGVQALQSAITLRSDMYVARSGRRFVNVTRLLRGEAHAVTQGHDPVCLSVDNDVFPILVAAGNDPWIE